MTKVKTNRKRTKGRNVYYQDVFNEDGKVIKTIKHVQESPTRIMIAEKLMQQQLDALPKGVCSEKTLRRKLERDHGVLIWKSREKGTYRGAVKDLWGEK